MCTTMSDLMYSCAKRFDKLSFKSWKSIISQNGGIKTSVNLSLSKINETLIKPSLLSLLKPWTLIYVVNYLKWDDK